MSTISKITSPVLWDNRGGYRFSITLGLLPSRAGFVGFPRLRLQCCGRVDIGCPQLWELLPMTKNIRNASHFLRQLLRNFIPSLIALCGFFLLCGLVLLVRGQNPLEFYSVIFVSGFATFDDFGYVLFNATPLIFTGLAVAIGYKGGLFNIGCEGQLYVAAFAATWIGMFLNLPSVVLIPFCMGAALIAGAVWGAVPGLLESDIRHPRSHQHDYDELHRLRADELPCHGGLPRTESDESANTADSRSGALPAIGRRSAVRYTE